MHLGNIGIALPELAKEDPEDLMLDYFSRHDVIITLPYSLQHQTSSRPAYTLHAHELAKYYDKCKVADSSLPHTKILDFGSGELSFLHTSPPLADHTVTAHKTGTPTGCFECAVIAWAPEYVFAKATNLENPSPSEPPADVWALGILVINTGTLVIPKSLTEF